MSNPSQTEPATQPPRILVVDDQSSMCEMLVDTLTPRGFDVVWRTSARAALEVIARDAPDVALTDLKMPDMDGIEFCRRVGGDFPELPVVVMTAFGSLESAVSAIRAGAFDFVTKPLDFEILDISLRRATLHSRLVQQIKRLEQAVVQTEMSGQMIGDSAVMQQLYDELARVAAVDTSVLVTGESGSGKEIAARCIHNNSSRNNQRFVAVNCAALPESLLESELFGHVPGAFTGAKGKREGLFVLASGGTLFLDEIGEMPLNMQPKLLRALEEKRIRPVGGNEEIPIDVRLIAATNRDLESAVENGRFREDLFYRINVIQINMPPLRSRGTDILLLAQHFINFFAEKNGKPIASMSEGFAKKLIDYNWPGNIRELRNTIERAVVLTDFGSLRVEDLPESIRQYEAKRVVLAGDDIEQLRSMEDVERQYIMHVLAAVDGNKALASRILGLDRKTLYRKLSRFESEEPQE